MLKQCSAFILLLAFMASSFSKAVIIADFYANQDYIAKNLCENKDKPMMNCCGKCMLRKRLHKEANQDQNDPERRADNKEVMYFDQASAALDAPVVSVVDLPYSSFSPAAPVDQPATIDHPPA